MILIPPDASIRLSREGGAWCVSIARSGAPSSLLDCLSRSGQSGIVTHDPGMNWPDRKGVALINALLTQPEAAAFLLFATNADAVGCWTRLEGGTK